MLFLCFFPGYIQGQATEKPFVVHCLELVHDYAVAN